MGLWSRIEGSQRVQTMCWWYLALCFVTALAKFAALDAIYARNVGSALAEIMASGHVSAAPGVVVALLLGRDFVQSALIASVVYAAVSALPDRAGALLWRGTLLFLMILLAGHQISFLELGTFASTTTLVTTWVWVSHQPAALQAYLTWPNGLGLCLVLLLCALPEWLSTVTRTRAPRLRRALPLLTLALVVAGLVLSPLASARFGARSFATHGYWGSMLASAWRESDRNPALSAVPSEAALRAEYAALAYVPGSPLPATFVTDPMQGTVGPRHVLVVGLETAPRQLYPLTSASDLPTFKRMTERAIVSAKHYTTSPYTRIANFSILSGLYAPSSGLPTRFGSIETDGFGSVLKRHGYETSYIDSWVLDWLPGSGERAQAHMLGFDTVLDSAVKRDDGVFEVLVEAEQVAFARAFAQISAAQARGHHAAIFLGTMLGHAPWPAAQADQGLDARARIHKLNLVLDTLFEGLLQRLSEAGLEREVIIVVVGDHGLRLTDEFRSLGLRYEHSDLAYEVPFLLYAPGLVDRTVRVPFMTSHVDITPTLLQLLGVASPEHLHHGLSMLDGRLKDRVTFLPSSQLGPLDGLTWREHYLTQHSLSGVSMLGVGSDAASLRPMTALRAATLPSLLRDPAALLERFDRHTLSLAGALLRRARHPSPH